nr:peptidoglycan DD-metalloendopeptidase family protein [Desulfobacterales bacterium]
NEAYAAKRLVALYKLNWLGRYHVFASAQSIDQLFERKAALERILESDHHFWRRLIEDKQQLSDILLALNRQKEDKLAVDAKFRAQIQKLSRERAKRNKLLKAIRSQKSLGLAAIEVLKEASKELDRKIESLNQEIRSIRKAVKNAFAAFKGLLKIPVKGKIISSFGYYKDPELNVENFRSGIDIQAERGDPIRSVSDGQTLYSDWFKGFGNMIIIDHGDNYYTVYAHADELFKAKGDPVEMGEVIGTVGDTGSITGAKLYFEIRHRGKAQDPLAWLKKG